MELMKIRKPKSNEVIAAIILLISPVYFIFFYNDSPSNPYEECSSEYVEINGDFDCQSRYEQASDEYQDYIESQAR